MKLTQIQINYLNYVRKTFPTGAFELTLQTIKNQIKIRKPETIRVKMNDKMT